MPRKVTIVEDIRLEKFVHGGQVIAPDEDGKKLLVWGGLPGELVNVRIIKKKSSYREGVVVEVKEASKDRIEPNEPNSYLSTSPWQIVSDSLESVSKQDILVETFYREGLDIDWSDFYSPQNVYGYRNKLEIGFWGDDRGLHLAHFVRGAHGKQIIEGNSLADERLNESARSFRDELDKMGIWAGKLKTLMLRSNTGGEVVGALFVKDEDIEFGEFTLPKSLKGLKVYFSNPLSPASVITKEMYSFGDIKLVDMVLGKNITYDVNSFFQVNLEVFEETLKDIKEVIDSGSFENVLDYYSGVGTIGIAVGANKLIESDDSNVEMAKLNTIGLNTEVVHSKSEQTNESIGEHDLVILDPPRAGLHENLVNFLVENKPKTIVYLSCNPSTQARDVKMMMNDYRVEFARGYNFFPKTPHIESLIVLSRLN